VLASFLAYQQIETRQSSSTSVQIQTTATGPLSILTNRILFFGLAAFQGNAGPSVWTLGIHNNMNESIRVEANFFYDSVPMTIFSYNPLSESGELLTVMLGPGQTIYSNTTYALTPKGTFTVSVFAFTSNGVRVTNSTATVSVANEVQGSIRVENDQLVSSVSSANYLPGHSNWVLTLRSNGTKPIALIAALLSNATGAIVGLAYSYLNGSVFVGTGNPFTPFPTLEAPMLPGQSATLSPPFALKVTRGSAYTVTITVLSVDHTQSTTRTTVIAG